MALHKITIHVNFGRKKAPANEARAEMLWIVWLIKRHLRTARMLQVLLLWAKLRERPGG
jgi:hypothetical protein